MLIVWSSIDAFFDFVGGLSRMCSNVKITFILSTSNGTLLFFNKYNFYS